MIKILGVKRILMLIIFLSANVALATATYMYVLPENENLEGQLRSTRSQIGQKRAESERLRSEFKVIEEKKSYFENLQAAGFISNQNRLVARRRITDIQQYTKVLRASYNINPASIVKNRTVEEMGYAVLNSTISINVEALDDLDFYNFLYWMESAFPGHTTVVRVNLERIADINEASLRQIGSGGPLTLVRGNMDLVWRTIVPQADIKESNDFGTEGF